MMNLYHGSGYDQTELMPGFKHSGKIVQWDETESNEWLYSTSSKEEAIAQGFASVLEKHYNLDRYKSDGDLIIIEIATGRIPVTADLFKLDVWLYTIQHDGRWRPVNNKHNGMKDEYKTKETIRDSILDKEKIDIAQWLGRKKVKVVNRTNRAHDW